MRITAITVTYSRTLASLPGGEARLEVRLSAQAEPGDDLRAPEEVAAALDTLWAMARDSARAQGRDLIARRATAARAGGPVLVDL